ncbi:MAG TPA: flagellar hook capping FlgD N-terminal domain-containing protein [Bacillota bacterium]|nr:flagellar hook capping FlgD N-terminal domain-containing protein [Bacillota bacterium]
MQSIGLTGSSSVVSREQLLRLMVAQLQNQNPLEPVSSQEFFSQLSQMLMVESLERLRTGLEAMVPQLGPEATALATLAGFVGRTILVETPTGPIQSRVDGVRLVEGQWRLTSGQQDIDPALIRGMLEN